jgi:hypothetical protein
MSTPSPSRPNKPATCGGKSLQQDYLLLGHLVIIVETSKKMHLEQKHIKIRLLCGATSQMSQCNVSKKVNQT